MTLNSNMCLNVTSCSNMCEHMIPNQNIYRNMAPAPTCSQLLFILIKKILFFKKEKHLRLPTYNKILS